MSAWVCGAVAFATLPSALNQAQVPAAEAGTHLT